MAKLGGQLSQDAVQQGHIAPQLLYSSAHLLSLDALAYEMHLQDLVETNLFLSCSDTATSSASSSGEFIDDTVAYRPRLSDVLLEQWYATQHDTQLHPIAELIVSNLSPQGYHVLSLQQLAASQYSVASLQQVAQIIAHFQPIGCATQDWIESIWVQSLHQPLHSQWASIGLHVWRESLMEWEEQGHLGLVRLEELGLATLEELKEYIRGFTLHPGLQYDTSPTQYQFCELELLFGQEGNYEVVLHERQQVSRLSDSEYDHLMQQARHDPDSLRWLRRQWHLAGQTVAMHRYRSMQVLRVANHLVLVQRSYLERKSSKLQPLSLADVAEALQTSIATVSRTIKDKSIVTPHAKYRLKSLLSRKQEHNGHSYSQQEIKGMIKNILYRYGSTKISDAKIARLLELEGVFLARRTVNKYRHQSTNLLG
jgi:RNA polymerase sigma-54 factor